MYVVIEYNQASQQPRVYDDTVFEDRRDAEDARDDAWARLKASGRRERYEVAALDIDDPEG